ncbi:MAG: ABC transporter permease subunit [Firmicutes bacterium]|nr:ABC transporter permease subunit [Bacillota bacterium]
MYTYSLEHRKFVQKKKRQKYLILFLQFFILVFFLLLWEVSAKLEWVNPFLSSSPSQVFETFFSLWNSNQLLNHIKITVFETIISFGIATILGFIIATILWWSDIAAKVLDPYLTVINSLPKVALGPLVIIWVGANMNSIIFMALMISIFITIINIYSGFASTEHYFITLLKTLNAKKWQIFVKLIVPSNKNNIINCLKINISMSLIGIIIM